MPLPKGTRYGVTTTKTGKKIRLAFKKGTNKVIERKNLDTGATHTPAEFAVDRMKKHPTKLAGGGRGRHV